MLDGDGDVRLGFKMRSRGEWDPPNSLEGQRKANGVVAENLINSSTTPRLHSLFFAVLAPYRKSKWCITIGPTFC